MIAACLIVKNSAETITATLESIRPFVDEINVLDTGSTDATLQVLADLDDVKITFVLPDGRLSDTPEEGSQEIPLAPIRVKVAEDVPVTEDGGLADFSWARTESFAMASPEHDWFFWLDDDDIIVGAQNLRALAASAHPRLDGYVVFYNYAQAPDGTCVCSLWRERLVRRNENWAWTNPVHEVFLPKPDSGIAPNYVMLPPEQLHYVHRRPPDRYPPTRNLKILERLVAKCQEDGAEPDLRTTAYMGTELMSQQRIDEAVPWFHRYLSSPGSTIGDERSQVYHRLSLCLRQLGDLDAAVEVEFQAIRERDDWAENTIGLAELFALQGRFDRAEFWAKRTIELGQPQSMMILNPLEFTLVPYVRLGEAAMRLEHWDEARAWLAKAAAVQPEHEFVQAIGAELATNEITSNLVKSALLLRETLVRYDENLKALHLLENLPYVIDEHPTIVRTRAMQRENVMHTLKPEEYKRWYEDEPKESTVPDEWVPEAGDYIERAAFLLETARAWEAEHGRKPRMLDLGCNDAWMAGYLWLKGPFVCDGIELNKGSVEKAAGRVERFGIPGRVIQGDIFDAPILLGEPTSMEITSGVDEPISMDFKVNLEPYDIVSCFEVYEHVPDSERLLELMESLLTDDGVACVTTPNGAFERGNIQMWHLVERKGHVRAVPAHELAKQLQRRGQITDFNVHSNGHLTYAAWKPKRKRGKVVFFAGGAWEQWSPASVYEGGLGGSETALSVVSSRLAQQGFEVNVYTDALPGLYGGAVWRPSQAFDPSEEADAFIVSRAPQMFDVDFPAPVRALWCHDHSYDGLLTEARAARMTDLILLSNWERDRYAKRYPFLEPEQLRVIRNGILYRDAEQKSNYPDGGRGFDKRKPRVVYSSSADRGLDVLLELWPRIRAQVPVAELHVFYGWDVFDAVTRFQPQLAAYKTRVLGMVEELGGEEGGIFMRGRVGQRELAAEMSQARVWGYPTAFLETSCIGAMEARAAGLPIVVSDLAALSETVGSHGFRLPWGVEPPWDEEQPFNRDEAYQATFVGQVARLLTDKAAWSRWHKAALEDVAALDWSHRVDEWAELIMSRKENPYLPAEYVSALAAG